MSADSKTPRTHLIDTTPERANARAGATYLADRGVDDDVARARGYRFASRGGFDRVVTDACTSAGVPDKYFKDGATAVTIPLWGLGATEPNITQVRVGSPESLPGTLAGRRFLLPKGSGRADTPRRNPLDVNPHPFNDRFVRDATVPLLITEGAPKGDSALSAAIREEVAIGIVTVTGVDMPIKSGENGERDELHPKTIGSLAWRPLLTHRVIILAFDADMWSKSPVANALRKTAVQLEIERGADVRVLVLDPNGPKGIDDYLLWAESKGERKPLTKLIHVAKKFSIIEKQLIQRNILTPRPKPRPLGEIDMFSAMSQWFLDVDEEVQEDLAWAIDLAGNSVIRAHSEAAKEVLGGWSLYPEDGILKFVCEDDPEEAKRIVAALATSSLDQTERGQLLAYDRAVILEELGIGKSVDLDVVDRARTLEHAITEVRAGREKGFSFLLDRSGRTEVRAEIASSAQLHGIWEITNDGDGVPVDRKRILPWVPAQGGEHFYRVVDFDSRFSEDQESTGFAIRAIFAGGQVRIARGVPVIATMKADAAVTAFRKAGVRVQGPVGYGEREAFERALNLVGFDEVAFGAMYSQLGYVIESGAGERAHYVYATLNGGLDEQGIREDVIASMNPDVRKRAAGLNDWTRRVAFTEIATASEATELISCLREYLAVAPIAVTLPIAAQVLGSLVPRGGSTPSIYLHGESKSRKTSIVSALISGFVDWRGGREEHKSASIIADSPAAVARLGAFHGNLPFVVDDLVETKELEKIAAQGRLVDDAITAAYEGGSGARALQDGSMRDNLPHVESPIFTAESRDPIAASRQTRAIMCALREGDVDIEKLDAWRDRWLATGKLNRILGFLIVSVLECMNDESSDDYGVRIGGMAPGSWTDWLAKKAGLGSDREEVIVSHNLGGLAAAISSLRYSIREGVEEDEHDRFHEDHLSFAREFLWGDHVAAIVDAQRTALVEIDDGRQIISEIESMIASGAAYVTDAAGHVPFGADRYGYRRRAFRGDVTFEPATGAHEAGRLSRDGTLVLLNTKFATEVRNRLVGKDPKGGKLRSALDPFLAPGYEGRGGGVISGLLLQDDRKTNLARRGYPVLVETLGLESEAASDRIEPHRTDTRPMGEPANY